MKTEKADNLWPVILLRVRAYIISFSEKKVISGPWRCPMISGHVRSHNPAPDVGGVQPSRAGRRGCGDLRDRGGSSRAYRSSSWRRRRGREARRRRPPRCGDSCAARESRCGPGRGISRRLRGRKSPCCESGIGGPNPPGFSSHRTTMLLESGRIFVSPLHFLAVGCFYRAASQVSSSSRVARCRGSLGFCEMSTLIDS
jgi:hypothetical protein